MGKEAIKHRIFSGDFLQKSIPYLTKYLTKYEFEQLRFGLIGWSYNCSIIKKIFNLEKIDNISGWNYNGLN